MNGHELSLNLDINPLTLEFTVDTFGKTLGNDDLGVKVA